MRQRLVEEKKRVVLKQMKAMAKKHGRTLVMKKNTGSGNHENWLCDCGQGIFEFPRHGELKKGTAKDLLKKLRNHLTTYHGVREDEEEIYLHESTHLALSSILLGVNRIAKETTDSYIGLSKKGIEYRDDGTIQIEMRFDREIAESEIIHDPEIVERWVNLAIHKANLNETDFEYDCEIVRRDGPSKSVSMVMIGRAVNVEEDNL